MKNVSSTSNNANQIEVIGEILKPSMLEKLITARKLLSKKNNSNGSYTNAMKLEITIQITEISTLIGIINYMSPSQTTKMFNIK